MILFPVLVENQCTDMQCNGVVGVVPEFLLLMGYWFTTFYLYGGVVHIVLELSSAFAESLQSLGTFYFMP